MGGLIQKEGLETDEIRQDDNSWRKVSPEKRMALL